LACNSVARIRRAKVRWCRFTAGRRGKRLDSGRQPYI
jgi:hypothetical protein